MAVTRLERDAIQEATETWEISNIHLTSKTRHHMHINEGVSCINICIINWIVIIFCENYHT